MATDSIANSSAKQATSIFTSGSTLQYTDAKAIVKDGYNVIAHAYLTWSARSTSARLHYLEKLFTHLPQGANVLELGCGAGVPCTQALVEHGFNVTAIDISSTQIALAHRHVPRATLICADMMSLSFEPERFDALVAFYSIIHLPKEEQGTLIGRIGGWLKKGGWLLCNFSTDEGDQMMEDWMGVRMYWSGLGVDGNREVLERNGAGLRIVEDEVVVETLGSTEEKFHWVLAVKNNS